MRSLRAARPLRTTKRACIARGFNRENAEKQEALRPRFFSVWLDRKNARSATSGLLRSLAAEERWYVEIVGWNLVRYFAYVLLDLVNDGLRRFVNHGCA